MWILVIIARFGLGASFSVSLASTSVCRLLARRLPGHIDRNARLVDALNGFRRWCWYLSVPSSSPNIAGPALSGLLVAVVVVEMIAVMAMVVVMVKTMTWTTTTTAI